MQGATGASGSRSAAGNRTGRDRLAGRVGGRLGFGGSDDEGLEDGEGDGCREVLQLSFVDITCFTKLPLLSLNRFSFVKFPFGYFVSGSGIPNRLSHRQKLLLIIG